MPQVYISGKPRIPGRNKRLIITALISILILLLIIRIVISGAINWPVTAAFFFHPAILNGLVMTLQLTVLSMLAGIILGTLLATMSISRYRVVNGAAALYIWLFRGTPLLVQLIFWFNIALVFPVVGFGSWQISVNALITPFIAAVLGLGLNEGAYMAEIVRAGLNAVDSGQTEAAHSLGLSRTKVMTHVVFPQALRIITPPTANQIIGMLKNTSLVSVIGAQELLTRSEDIYARNFHVIELLVVASIWYLILTTVASGLQYWLERHLEGKTAHNLLSETGV
ncbi:amino acid ABC transporter permease [Martelella alba]|uniref:Amino acid ABC transporter permease n=1 Tax=Martelella alba TaxID=2590451 RepID=A0ABY2SMJ6_9HYPH|nr:amino acid ABC transporter permease [Martelella alba]